MTKWKCPTDDQGAALLEAVALAVRSVAGIGEAEAVARLNYFWGHLPLLSEEDKESVAHREPAEWARLIYFGRQGQPEPGDGPASLSFTAQPVIRWVLDEAGRRLTVAIDRTQDAAPIRPAFEIRFGPCSVMRGYRKKLGLPAEPVGDVTEPLCEVNEFGFGPPVAWMKGFGAASGDWLHYEFEGPVQVL
jgi:hypothetical protein